MTDASKEKQKLLIIYGSETGNAESISKRLHQEATELGYDSTWACLKDFRKLSLDKLEAWPSYPIIFVISSTGDGDPPENAETFWRQLRRKTKSATSHLEHVRFLILGLGDSNYDSYQGFPLGLYGKLTQLGAKPILALAKADEATGSLEDYLEPWIAELWPDLQTFLQTGETIPVPVLDGAQKPVPSTVEASAVPLVAPVPTIATSSASSTSVAPSTSAAEPKKEPTSTVAPGTPVSNGIATPMPTLVPVATPTSTPVPTSGTKTPKGPILPKAPVHASKVTFLGAPTGDAPHAARFKQAAFPPTKDAPYLANVLACKTLTAPDAVKEVCEMKLEICAGKIWPGDAIGMWPQNCPQLTERMLKVLDISNPDELFQLEALNADPKAILPSHVPARISLRSCFLNHINFTGPVSKRVLVMLSQYCSNPSSTSALMELVTDRSKFKLEVEDCYASVLDILERYPDCKPNLGHLLDSLSPLLPRYFSIANYDSTPEDKSDASHKSIFKFIFSIETAALPNKIFHGVATNWLKNNFIDTTTGATQKTVPIFIRPRSEFTMSSDKSKPIIMCSAGTGLAPFMSFLEQRRHWLSQGTPVDEIGKGILITGHRHPNMDWLYHKEVQALALEKDQVHTAFSRLHPSRVEYIQSLLAQETLAKQVIDLMMNHGAIWYVCGDARKMATQLRETLVQILQTHGGMDSKQASEQILSWSKSKRYLLDIWG